ncbi:MAG: oligosaccharide flippase family protein [Candidatus Krumholzibacteriota bacterium]|nr:oligosaccharide flippase family protein [Candidatus Krumholzibacteriota bacterium]
MPRTLSHQVGILMLGRVVALGVMLVTPMVNVRALSIEEYGYYRQFWLLFETFSPILILGFPQSLLYYLPRAKSDHDKAVYVTQTIVFSLALSSLSLLIYAVMAHTLGEGMGAVARAFYWRMSAFAVLMIGCSHMEWLFVAARQVGRQSLYHVTVSSLQAIVVIATAWISRDVGTIIWALTIFALAKFLFAISYTWITYRPSLRMISIRTMREQLSFALPVGLFGIVLILLAQTDKFIINRFLGREAFAIYAVGAFQIPFVNIVSQSVRNVVFPLMAMHQQAGRHREIADLWRRAMLRMGGVFFPLFVVLEVLARPVITLFFTADYSSAAPIFMIYLILLVRSTIDTGAIIQVFKRTGYLVRIFSLAFCVNLGLSVALFQVWGREGVAAATVITMLVTNVINIHYSSRLTETTFLGLLPVAGLLKRMGVALLPGIPLWLARPYIDGSFLHIALLGGGYMAMYFVLSSAAGYITFEDLRSLLGRRNGS